MATPETYTDVFARLERDKVRYVVVSGMAVVLHGYVRSVVDLDIVIDRSPDEADRAMMALAASGFVPSIPLPLSTLTVMRMFDGMNREVDVFARYHVAFEELMSASEMVRVGDGMVRVASVEHVIRAKRITGRPHDVEDVAGLLGVVGVGGKGPDARRGG